MNLAVIILAAGQSTRMQSDLPKILHKIAGKPMINYVLDIARNLGAKQIITVVNPNINLTPSEGEQIAIQHQALGTAHAVQSAIEQLDKNLDITLILYGDTPLITQDTIEAMLENMADLSVLGFEFLQPNEYGKLIVQGEKLVAIIEHKEASPQQKQITLCNSGVIAIKTKILLELIVQVQNNNAKGEYYLTDLIALANEAGYQASFSRANSSEILGINNRQELAVAEQVMQTRLRNEFMNNGVSLIDPSSVIFAADTKLGRDVVIGPFVVFGNQVIVEDHVEIRAFSHIEGSYISSHTIVGPYARLRPGTHLKEYVHIGNFVEIKNANIDSGSKVNHLSYIGDTDIGSGCNIGAGTITCNYDGFKKHRTSIGKNVFVGSNSSLIAPLVIEQDAMVAAGSVLTQAVPENSLAIARSKCIILPGGASKIKNRQKNQ